MIMIKLSRRMKNKIFTKNVCRYKRCGRPCLELFLDCTRTLSRSLLCFMCAARRSACICEHPSATPALPFKSTAGPHWLACPLHTCRPLFIGSLTWNAPECTSPSKKSLVHCSCSACGFLYYKYDKYTHAHNIKYTNVEYTRASSAYSSLHNNTSSTQKLPQSKNGLSHLCFCFLSLKLHFQKKKSGSEHEKGLKALL